uniref:Uncharacterized protein n=1 Tax=Kalanchoe fedtschenkoi TaxID=63787 RepID=A0A7N0RJS1_KALFE
MEATKSQTDQPQLEIHIGESHSDQPGCSCRIKASISSALARFHAGYFRISLSLSSQALLWKTLSNPPQGAHSLRRMLGFLPTSAFILLWSLALSTTVALSVLYLLRCMLHYKKIKVEVGNNVGVNYLFVPWISCLFLIQSSPFNSPDFASIHFILWWVFTVPIFILDVKIYGQWFTKGKNKFLSIVANPSSLLSVVGNLVGARGAAIMGWREVAIFMFALGMTHYLVLFVTIYQRLQGSNSLPTRLKPVFFLVFAAPSMAALAWDSISPNKFDNSSKMLFFVSLFNFLSLVCRPTLFKKSMKKFHVAWWAYSFPLTILALASAEYAQEVQGVVAHSLMLALSATSVTVTLLLMVFTAFKSNGLVPRTRQ